MTPAERAKLQRLRQRKDVTAAEYNAYRKKVKNRIDQARHRARKAAPPTQTPPTGSDEQEEG